MRLQLLCALPTAFLSLSLTLSLLLLSPLLPVTFPRRFFRDPPHHQEVRIGNARPRYPQL